jgi:hypothetical protein
MADTQLSHNIPLTILDEFGPRLQQLGISEADLLGLENLSRLPKLRNCGDVHI